MGLKFFLLIILSISVAQDEELMYIVTKSGLNYHQLMDWSDSLWVNVESGILTPDQAQAMFLDETGMRIIDFLVRSGEIILAVEKGLVPKEVVDDLIKNTN